jgi:hypothetical protein
MMNVFFRLVCVSLVASAASMASAHCLSFEGVYSITCSKNELQVPAVWKVTQEQCGTLVIADERYPLDGENHVEMKNENLELSFVALWDAPQSVRVTVRMLEGETETRVVNRFFVSDKTSQKMFVLRALRGPMGTDLESNVTTQCVGVVSGK